GFLSQVIPFVDTDLEKLYAFARFLITKLPILASDLPQEIREQIALETLRIEQRESGTITLERGPGRLEPVGDRDGRDAAEDEQEALSQLIQALNERFGTEFKPEDRVFLSQLEAQLDGSEGLKQQVRTNSA